MFSKESGSVLFLTTLKNRMRITQGQIYMQFEVFKGRNVQSQYNSPKVNSQSPVHYTNIVKGSFIFLPTIGSFGGAVQPFHSCRRGSILSSLMESLSIWIALQWKLNSVWLNFLRHCEECLKYNLTVINRVPFAQKKLGARNVMCEGFRMRSIGRVLENCKCKGKSAV